jgi:hypothetical protein
MKHRLRAKLEEVADELRQRRHQLIPEQGRSLGSVVRGHIAYFGVPSNRTALDSFRRQAGRSWDRCPGQELQLLCPARTYLITAIADPVEFRFGRHA